MKTFVQNNKGLIVPVEFAEKAAPADLNEIATTANGRDITRGWLEGNPLMASQDTVLQSRGGGDLKVYEELYRDDQVKSVFEQRRLAVVSKEWEVIPGDDSARAEEAAEFISENLDTIGFDRITRMMLSGVFYGYAVGECMWKVENSMIMLDTIKVRRQRRFAYAPDKSLRLRTMAQPFGEALPDRKFWHYSCGADNDDEPYGLGLAHWLYWPVFFKRNGIKFWLFFLEKFGQPTAKGTYPVNSQLEERNRLLAALNAISTDTGLIIPEGMQIELLEAARSGTADYTELYDRMDAAIAKVIIGHTGSSDSTPGRLGGEDNASEVRQDIVKADADLICESINDSVIKWMTEWNYGPDVAPPQVWRKVEESEDLNSLAERDERLNNIGYRPTLKRILDVYGPDYELAPAPQQAVQPFVSDNLSSTQFAEGDGRDIVDAQADNFDVVSADPFAKIMEPIRRLVETATSLQDIRDGLVALYPDMDDAGFARLLQEAMTAANLAGRADIKDTVNG